jgi:putative ABC transport system permease protein
MSSDSLSVFFRKRLQNLPTFKRVFKLFSIHYYKKNIWKGSLAILGIALGVCVLYSMNAATFAAFTQFKQGIQQISGQTSLEILSENNPFFNETILSKLYQSINSLEGAHYTDLHPVLELPTLLLSRDSKGHLTSTGQVLNLLGVDTLNDATHRPLDWKEAPLPPRVMGESLPFFSPHAVAVSDVLAQEYGWHRGSRFPVLLQDRQVTLTVVGIFKTSGKTQAFRHLGITDLSVLQNMSHTVGLLSRIEVDLGSLSEQAIHRIQNQLQAQLPKDLSIQAPEERQQQMGNMLRSYQVNLMALSFITLMVAAFLIYNTLSMSILQRRQAIGTYRLLGLSAKMLALFIQLEAFVLGVLGSLLGLLLGMSILPLVGQAVSSTLQNVYTGQSAMGFAPPDWLAWAALIIGISTSLLGAYFPVQEALQIQPADYIRPLSESFHHAERRHYFAKIGIIFIVLAGGASLLPPFWNLPLGGYLAAFLILMGGSLLIPTLLRSALKGLHQLALQGKAPLWFRLGISLLQGGLHRSAVAVASLMVALALSISLTTLIGSFRHSVEDWIDKSLRADIFVQPQSASTHRHVGLLSAKTVQALSTDSAVAEADPFLEQAFVYEGKPFYLGVAQLDIFARHARLTFTEGESSDEILARSLALSQPISLQRKTPYPTLISEPFAHAHHLKRGDTFTLNMPKGALSLQVQGVYFDYASSLGYAIIHRSLYQAYGGPQADASSTLALYLKPHQQTDTVLANLTRRIPQGVWLSMRSNQALRQEVLGIFDKTFTITYLMQGVALLISILTVLHALTTLILDGKRIYATLDYLGMSRALQVRLVMNQGMLLSLLGYSMAFIFGMMLAGVLIYVLNAQSFGWSVPLKMPWEFLIKNLFWVMAAGLVASFIPLWILRRQKSTSSLRYE